MTQEQKIEMFERAEELWGIAQTTESFYIRYAGMTECFMILGIYNEYLEWRDKNELPY